MRNPRRTGYRRLHEEFYACTACGGRELWEKINGDLMTTIHFSDGEKIPALGQGTWEMGDDPRKRAQEIAALREGIELGMTLIDTAEMYGEGKAEELVGEAIYDLRDRVFLVTKVYPQNASRAKLPEACARSLRRLRTDTIDLYLLHWRGAVPLSETIEAFEKLRVAGKIRRWGVSNLDRDEMEELGASDCATNQVLYNLQERGIEFDLLPWAREREMPIMAYSPIGQGGELLQNETLRAVAQEHEASAAQIALAWVLRKPGVIAIPKASSPAHVRENAAAAEIRLTNDDLAQLDEAFPPPRRKQKLAMI